MKWIILYSILSFCSSSLSAKNYWKHSEQQGKVGACHAFATIALVEAEYWVATGKHINLSERDLFIRHYTSGYTSTSAFISSHLRAAAKTKLPAHYKESGHISNDFDLAKRHGVASERELPYSPIFRNGLSMSVKRLRFQRDAIYADIRSLKKSQTWSASTTEQKIQQHHAKLRGLDKAFQLPSNTKTREWTRNWLAGYQLMRSTPKTTPLAKKLIIEQLAHHPVAVDVSNFSELMNSSHYTTNYTRHSLVVSHYDKSTDQFTIRSSTHKGSTKVSADALSRGTYQLYYLKNS